MSGGRDAFDAKLAETIEGIPEEGMTRSAFTAHLMPFLAFVGDAHTVVHADLDVDWSRPGGIPLYFGAVGRSCTYAVSRVRTSGGSSERGFGR